jgi:hypothetical protein
VIVEDAPFHSVLIAVKAVPGASRDQIAGVLGDRLKVRVSAPPEGGKANEAIRRVVARALGLKARDVFIESGASSPEKLLLAVGIDAAEAGKRLGVR